MMMPKATDVATTAMVCFVRDFLSGQMIFLYSALRPLNQLFLGAFSAASLIFPLSFPASYFVSLCSVCFLQNLQYLLVSILSGWFFFSFVML